jgi:N-formylglutamate amidohydrolase
VQEQTKQMMQAVGQQITNAAYKRVIADINRDIVPKVNSMVEFVNYQMQDPGEIVTDYRRAVHQQANEGQKLLTDGNDKHVISEHVSLFFREDN